MLDSGLNEDISSLALLMEDDGDVKVTNVFGNNSMDEDSSDVDDETKKMKDEEDGESDGGVVVEKGKRGRKRKVVGRSEEVKVKNDGVKVSGRVLRSSVKMTSGSVQVGKSRLDESVVAFKRQMEAECFDPMDLDKEVDEKSPVMGRLNKKQKLSVSSPKMQGEIDFSRKILDENDVEEVGESALLKEQKKQECHGRPPKTQGEIGYGRKILDENDVEEVDERALLIGKEQEKQKRLGRPPTMDGETGLSQTTKFECLDDNDVKEVDENTMLSGTGNQQKKQKHLERSPKVQCENLKRCGRWPRGKPKGMVVKMQNSQLKSKVVLETPKICDVQSDDGSSEISGDNKEYVKTSEENNDHTTAEDTVKSTNTSKLNSRIGEADSKRMEQQLVRDQIVNMIMKAGWTIEYRPRQKYREYLDTIYIDRQGKAHWSVTNAYFSLKMKIEEGVACSTEVSAFTSIPKKELRVLLRPGSKVRSNKNLKEKKRKECL